MTTKTDILRAIRRKCLDCSCEQPGEVQKCPVTACELWPFRLGLDPEPSRRGFGRALAQADATDTLHVVAASGRGP
jgi:hypothetical protein